MAWKVLVVFGTRPEAIKLAPLIRELEQRPEQFLPHVCVTAQHRELLDNALSVFSIRPHTDLNVMLPGQSLGLTAARILAGLEDVFAAVRPDIVLVQGDTTSTLCGALAAFYRRVPCGHVEAGLRTGDMARPFPEEMNRVVTGRLSTLHFAPTRQAAEKLLEEGVSQSRVFITGNTGIDAVLYVRNQIEAGRLRSSYLSGLPNNKRWVTVTAHRRESFGAGFEGICEAMRRLARRQDVILIYPVHPNPQVREQVQPALVKVPGIQLVEPLPYPDFVELMMRSDVLLTDSGGVQEEAPALGKPVVVMREKTERPEAVDCGTAVLAGTDPEVIAYEVNRILDDPVEQARRSRVHSPYGDGFASRRIADLIYSFLKG